MERGGISNVRGNGADQMSSREQVLLENLRSILNGIRSISRESPEPFTQTQRLALRRLICEQLPVLLCEVMIYVSSCDSGLSTIASTGLLDTGPSSVETMQRLADMSLYHSRSAVLMHASMMENFALLASLSPESSGWCSDECSEDSNELVDTAILGPTRDCTPACLPDNFLGSSEEKK